MPWRDIERRDVRKPESWWIKQRVRSKEAIGNSLGISSVRTIFAVERKWAGLNLRSKRCGRCGMQLRVSRVRYSHLEIWEYKNRRVKCPRTQRERDRIE